ncbi:MAG: c-type cytochrome [Legionella sp.]|nr:c-type cytochrome [Legionella sp.]
MKQRLQWLVLILSSLLTTGVLAATHHPQEFLDSIRGKKNEGAKIVQHFCANCHAVKPLIELGAPKLQSETDWGPRVKQGLDRLLKHTVEGYGAMPARGGCFECTDEQLRLAIASMLPKSMQKDHK